MSQNSRGIVTVYHGSTYLINDIDVNKVKPYKDFDRGFYVIENRLHVEKLAIHNKRIEIERNGNKCGAYLYTYEFGTAKLSGFNVKVFNNPDIELIQFVLANHKSRNSVHNYDIVMGLTADDDTLIVINAFLDGLYGEIGSEDALSMLIKNIEAENLPGQIFFLKNEAARLFVTKGKAVRL